MAITNQSKPTTTYTNASKVNIGETWASDSLQWQNESRTWNATISIISNPAKVSSSMTNVAKP